MKFWRPQGCSNEAQLAIRVSDILAIRTDPISRHLYVETRIVMHDDRVRFEILYPTIKARDADCARLMEALEEE